jgi:3-hydroxy acid dehydrogenase/malonic semialdehyde reductase
MKNLLFFCVCLLSTVWANEGVSRGNPVAGREIALVTGASSGIGKALVIELLAQGYEVIGVARSIDKLEKLQAELQNDHFFIYFCDVSDLENVKQVYNKLKQDKKIPRFFFLNAGGASFESEGPVRPVNLQEHRKVFALNYYGALNFVEQWDDACIENGGATFMVTSSLNAIFAPPGGSAYAAAKAAISKAFDGFNLTYFGKNLRFLSVFCGPVDTPMQSNKFPFTLAPEKVARFMIKKAKKGVRHSYPSWFYLILAKLLNALPEKQVFQILDLLSSKKEDSGPSDSH